MGLLAESEGLGKIQPQSEYFHLPGEHLSVIVFHASS